MSSKYTRRTLPALTYQRASSGGERRRSRGAGGGSGAAGRSGGALQPCGSTWT